MTGGAKDLAKAVQKGGRTAIAKAITLVESARPEDRKAADALIGALIPHAGGAIRIGITGIPGVGKSTFIEAFGLYLIGEGKRVGVLTVDPTSELSHGSILGDKTRMVELAQNEAAFIRPSPSSGRLGGVNPHTREAMIILEAAGFDVLLVETVGAGQSETEVAGMVDVFVVMQIPGAGDDLQGLKKGVLELADIIVINKAEKENKNKALRAVRDVNLALHIITPEGAHWTPPVLMCSALERTGMAAIWKKIQEFREIMTETGAWEEKRSRQALFWMKAIVECRLLADFRRHPGVMKERPTLEAEVRAGRKSPGAAAAELLALFGKEPRIK